MKRAASTTADLLIDLLADPFSVLSSYLRVSDLFCVRLTCKDAWRRISHKVLTKNNLWATALSGMRQPHIPMLRWCVRQELFLHDETAKLIGGTGSMLLIEECLKLYGRDMLFPLMAGAAKAGDSASAIDLFSRLDPDDLDLGHLIDFKECVSAGGSVEAAQLLSRTAIVPTPIEWGFVDIVPALRNGRREFVQWALSDTVLSPTHGELAVVHAAASGSIDLVQWLVAEHGWPITNRAVCSSAMAGQLGMLQWLDGQEGGNLQAAVPSATSSGQLHVLEWLIEQGCQVTEEVVHEAAETSNAATVAWLLDRGYPYDEETLVERARRNEKTDDVLKFLIEVKGVQCDEAVAYRRLGTPFSEDYVGDCVRSGDIARVRNALEGRAPFHWTVLFVMFEREECAMLNETIEYYLDNGKLTEQFRAWLDEAVSYAGCVSEDVARVLDRFGYEVPEESWARW